MDPTHQHTDPPPAKALLGESEPPPSSETRVLIPEPTSSASAPASKGARPNAFTVIAIAMLAIGLVALATWSYLSRQGDPASPNTPGQSDLPKDTVALINSTTPIPLRLHGGNITGSETDLTRPPDADSWTPALREAERAQDEGRYSAAISQYAALVGGGAPDEAREALWGLASAYEVSGQRELALRAYSLFAGLDDPRAPAAFVRVGRIYEKLAQFSDAAKVYAEYALLGGPAANAVKLMQARISGDTPEAEKLYNEVIENNPLDLDLRDALSSLAALKSRRGDHAGARTFYNRLIAEREKNPRPLLDHNGRSPYAFAADEAAQAGDKAGATKSLLAYISIRGDYAYGRYTALVTLLKLEPSAVVRGTVAPMLAAQIAFDAGYYGEAIGYMDIIRTATPDSPQRAEAALLTGRAFDLLGDTTSAYNWYTATVQVYPASPQAPEALRRAAVALEEESQWDASIAAYKQVAESYPNAGEQTTLARIYGAVLAYRLEDRDTAISLISPLASANISPTLKTQAAFWLAKFQKASGDNAWRITIQPVSTLSPGTYLDFRTRSLLANEPSGGAVVPTYTAALSTTTDYASEAADRAELFAWANTFTSTERIISPTITITSTSTVASATQNSNLKTQNSPEAQRAATLLDLGFDSESALAFRALADQLREQGDAPALAELVIYLRYHASPYTALRVATALSMLDRGDPTKQPTLLLKILYPLPYKSLVQAEAKQRDIDPLLVYALMRQESQFVPDARSGADARGLTQVIPSTGQGIAQQLGDTQFSVADLYLPYVNIRYGTYYLASNLPQFDRKLLPTLAAYNGGPGNAERWLQGSALLDPDLFAERIDLFETADYLETVYSNYGFYRLIYGRER